MSRSRERPGLGARPARSALGPLRGAERTGRSARSAVAAATVLLGIADARAAPDAPRAAMRIELVRGPGTEGCPGDAFLRAEVARRLGADPFQDGAPQLLTVRVAREGPELTAALALRDGEGDTRWADGFGTRSGCEELLSGVALAIVARLLSAPEPASPPRAPSPPREPASPPPEPSSSSPSEPSSPPATPSQAQRAAPEPPRPAQLPQASSRPETAPAPPERLRLEAGLGATLGLGITPGAAAGMTLAVGVRRSEWSVAVEGRGLVALAQEVGLVPVGTRAFTAATVACYRGRLLLGCGLATLGAVRFTPRDPWTMRSRSDVLFGFGARLGAEWPLSGRWSVLGYAETTWIVDDAALRRRPYDRATPATVIWTSPPLGTAFGLGITAAY
ncbi:hypothetical protein WMF45_07700 [Sorangium sp. So ce448]|uniref:hypothetical protein n=1 Tax=Sorangium sp. So ce448 TaxID=3133314 RepID=UPI003F610CA9